MARAWWMALAAVAALALTVAGCGSSEHGTNVRRIAFVDPGKDNDPDWTLQGKEVVEEFPQKLHVGVDTVDASRTSDLRGALQQVSHEGDQLVIAHDSRYAETAEAVAAETNVPELVWGERPHAQRGLVGQITVQDKESGYMLGVLAAHAAYTRRLGIVVVDDGSPWDLATWNRMAGGFVAGARSIDPRSRFIYRQVGDGSGHATYAQAHAAAADELEHGSQMLLILGGGSALGAQRALESRGGAGETLFMGAVSDHSSTVHYESGGVPYMIASIIWNMRGVFRQAVHDVRAGRFGEHPYALTLRDGGLTLYTSGRAPSDATEDAEREARRIEAGTLRVPVAATSEAVQALIAGAAEG
ncbi:MAG TPA: BMP family ABC transporter substrate-binding protein [Conexibacter sp.]|nr:BMP family ABC transporter substrate-binding protein [Conexibacter sp.]